jgi:hypothetical protein
VPQSISDAPQLKAVAAVRKYQPTVPRNTQIATAISAGTTTLRYRHGLLINPVSTPLVAVP